MNAVQSTQAMGAGALQASLASMPMTGGQSMMMMMMSSGDNCECEKENSLLMMMSVTPGQGGGAAASYAMMDGQGAMMGASVNMTA